MSNLHLLQTELTVEEYERLITQIDWSSPVILRQFPAYVIARCPFCLALNVERLDTYSVRLWSIGSLGHAAFDHRAVDDHCEHFALVQTFFHFHNIWPAEAWGMLGPEVPHVIGHLLESGRCLAVIHSLPICRIEGNAFMPRYTLFMVGYFSEQPEEAYQAVINFNAPYVEPGVAWPFIAPPEGCEQWWDLPRWVSAGQLFWVDGDDPGLGIRTHDSADFPYGHIKGRKWPYLHTFPYPLPKLRKIKSERRRKGAEK